MFDTAAWADQAGGSLSGSGAERLRRALYAIADVELEEECLWNKLVMAVGLPLAPSAERSGCLNEGAMGRREAIMRLQRRQLISETAMELFSSPIGPVRRRREVQ